MGCVCGGWGGCGLVPVRAREVSVWTPGSFAAPPPEIVVCVYCKIRHRLPIVRGQTLANILSIRLARIGLKGEFTHSLKKNHRDSSRIDYLKYLGL